MVKKELFITWPSNFIRKKTKKIKGIDKKKIKKIKNLIEITKNNLNIIGVAANQIKSKYRIFIINIYDNKKKKYKKEIFINPKIIKKSKFKIFAIESCLSVVGKSGIVKRSKYILIKYKNIYNKTKIKIFEGINSICIQHEVDHLNGILWIDY